MDRNTTDQKQCVHESLEKWARQWASGQKARWAYESRTPTAREVEARIQEAREKIEALGYSITTDDWGYVVIRLPFKV